MKYSACPNGSFSDFLADVLKGLGKGPHNAKAVMAEARKSWPFRKKLSPVLVADRLKHRPDVTTSRKPERRGTWSRYYYQHVEVVA